MNRSKLSGLLFVALSFILFTLERIAAHAIWGIHKAGVAAHGSGQWSTEPDLNFAYENPAVWLSLALGVALFFLPIKPTGD